MQKNNQKIPEGWSVKKLKECLEIKHGKPQHEVEDKNGIYPILASGGEIGRTNSFLCNKPSVLIGRKGTIDKPQYMDTPFWTVDTLFYSLIKSGYLAKYIFYKFETINWNKYNEGSTIPSLSSSTIHSIKIILPPLAEQEKIAEILGTWDEAIEKLSNLIEQKKLLKKGLMQKLLTGKTRLPGFTQPWKEVKLGEITNKISDKNHENCSNVVTISAQNGFVNQDDFFNKFVSSDTLTNYYLLQKGDFGYNRSYSKGYPLGAIKKLNNHKKAVVSTLYICFRALKNKINSVFLEQYFEIGLLNKELYKVAQEGARNHGLLNIALKDFFSAKLYIPSDISEQQAIADVLSTADDEINLLNQKLEALKEQKKGLMQQLLTGQIRVKVN